MSSRRFGGPRRVPVAIALLAFSIAGQPSATAADGHREQVVATALSRVIVPGFDAFAEDSAKLTAASEALCARPDADRLNGVRSHWRDAAVRWNRLLPYRFGPMKEGFPASLEWQIDTSLVPGGIRRAAIRDAIQQVVSAEYPIDIGVVARQKLFARGLHAIELMLYESRDGKLGGPAVLASLQGRTGERACTYLTAMARYTQLLAEELATGWQAFARQAATADESAERDPAILFDALINQSIALLDFVDRNKVRVVLRSQGGAAEFTVAAASGASLALIRANVQGVDTTFRIGFDDLLVQVDQEQLLRRYEARHRAVLNALDAIPEPRTEAAQAATTAVEKLAAALTEWRHLLRLEISQALGVAPNFTETDGD